MPTNFVMPRIDVPIGRTNTGALVYFDGSFLRTFLQQLADRIGGSRAPSNTELADAIATAAAGEVVMQPASTDRNVADVMQMAGVDVMFPDVMQGDNCTALGETTFQV